MSGGKLVPERPGRRDQRASKNIRWHGIPRAEQWYEDYLAERRKEMG